MAVYGNKVYSTHHNKMTLFPIPELPLQEKEQIPGPNANLTEQNSYLGFSSSKR